MDLLQQNTPDAIVLAILADFNPHSTREAVQHIVQQLNTLLHEEPQRFRDYFYMLEVLSENRDLKQYIKEAETMITQVNIQNLPSFELGMEKGMEKGIEKVIHHLLKKYPAEQVALMLDLALDKILELKKTSEH